MRLLRFQIFLLSTLGALWQGLSASTSSESAARNDSPSASSSGNALPAASSLVDLVVADPDLSTLETAVITAGLADLLSGPGPFTVFAPVNGAFATVDEALLAQLLTPEFILHLQNVLAFHVAQGSVLSSDLMSGMEITMLNEEAVSVIVNDQGVSLKSPLTPSAQVIQADINASNGVVHKIDGSILVPSFVGADLVDLLASNPDYSTLVSLIEMAGLEEAVRTSSALTILAPVNAAFDAVPEDILDGLLNDVDALSAVLTYHVIEGVASSSALKTGAVPTLNGEMADVVVSESGITIDGVPVTQPDLLARNGVVHGISAVLIPNSDGPSPASLPPMMSPPVLVPPPAKIAYPTTWQARPPAPLPSPALNQPVSPPARVAYPTTWQARPTAPHHGQALMTPPSPTSLQAENLRASVNEEQSSTGTSVTSSYGIGCSTLIWAAAMLF